jgi:hypothetical protein
MIYWDKNLYITENIIINLISGRASMPHSNEEVKAFLKRADVAAIGTTDLGMPRQRMVSL